MGARELGVSWAHTLTLDGWRGKRRHDYEEAGSRHYLVSQAGSFFARQGLPTFRPRRFEESREMLGVLTDLPPTETRISSPHSDFSLSQAMCRLLVRPSPAIVPPPIHPFSLRLSLRENSSRSCEKLSFHNYSARRRRGGGGGSGGKQPQQGQRHTLNLCDICVCVFTFMYKS